MEARIQLTVTAEEARLLYVAVAQQVETRVRMGLSSEEETQTLVMMRGALQQFAPERSTIRGQE